VPDYTDIESFVQSSTGVWETPQDKATAVWRWGRRSRRQTSCAVEGGRQAKTRSSVRVCTWWPASKSQFRTPDPFVVSLCRFADCDSPPLPRNFGRFTGV